MITRIYTTYSPNLVSQCSPHPGQTYRCCSPLSTNWRIVPHSGHVYRPLWMRIHIVNMRKANPMPFMAPVGRPVRIPSKKHAMATKDAPYPRYVRRGSLSSLQSRCSLISVPHLEGSDHTQKSQVQTITTYFLGLRAQYTAPQTHLPSCDIPLPIPVLRQLYHCQPASY